MINEEWQLWLLESICDLLVNFKHFFNDNAPENQKHQRVLRLAMNLFSTMHFFAFSVHEIDFNQTLRRTLEEFRNHQGISEPRFIARIILSSLTSKLINSSASSLSSAEFDFKCLNYLHFIVIVRSFVFMTNEWSIKTSTLDQGSTEEIHSASTLHGSLSRSSLSSLQKSKSSATEEIPELKKSSDDEMDKYQVDLDLLTKLLKYSSSLLILLDLSSSFIDFVYLKAYSEMIRSEHEFLSNAIEFLSSSPPTKKTTKNSIFDQFLEFKSNSLRYKHNTSNE
jgi:hypothetical protein